MILMLNTTTSAKLPIHYCYCGVRMFKIAWIPLEMIHCSKTKRFANRAFCYHLKQLEKFKCSRYHINTVCIQLLTLQLRCNVIQPINLWLIVLVVFADTKCYMLKNFCLYECYWLSRRLPFAFVVITRICFYTHSIWVERF